MNFKSKHIWLFCLLLALLCCFVFTFLSVNAGEKDALQFLQKEYAEMQKNYKNGLSIANKIAEQVGNIKSRKNNFKTKDFSTENVEYFVYKKGNLVYWSTNLFYPNEQYLGFKEYIHKAYLEEYAYFKEYKLDTLILIAAIKLNLNNGLNFSDLQLDKLQENSLYIASNAERTPEMIPIKIGAVGNINLGVENFIPSLSTDLWSLFFFLLTLVFLYVFLRKKEVAHSLILIFLVLVLYAVMYLFFKNLFLPQLKHLGIFNSEVYASSWYFPNLGIAIWNVFLVFLISIAAHLELNSLARKLRQNKFWLKLLIFGLHFFLFFYAAFFLDEISKLVLDSSINFDFYEIHKVTRYSFIGLGFILLGFLSFFNFYRLLLVLIRQFEINSKVHLYFIVMCLLCAVLVGYYFQLLTAIFVSCIFFFSYGLELIRENQFKQIFYLVGNLLICSGITAFVINKNVNAKERDVREYLATTTLLQNEQEPYKLFSLTEKSLLVDKGIVDYYTCLDETKSHFENRLKQLYFTHYAENYDILILDFDSLGRSYREPNALDYYSLNALFTSNFSKPLTKNFSYIADMKLKGSYIGRFNVFENEKFVGVYFVLLQPKLSQNQQGRLSDVFDQNQRNPLLTDNNYSYAIYTKLKLSRRFGNYNYSNLLDTSEGIGHFTQNHFQHYFYSDELGNHIIFSKPEKTWIQRITAFTFLLFIGILLAVIYIVFMWLRKSLLLRSPATFRNLRVLNFIIKRWPITAGSEIFLSNRIQLFGLAIVFGTFLLILIVTMNYFNNNYSSRQKQYLWNKTTDIANTIGTQANLDAMYNSYQTGLIYDLSNYYNTDISLYRSDGKLLTSSNDQFYKKNLLAPIMNTSAFAELHNNNSSGFIRDESIGSLKYIASYYALLDNNLNVRGYLSLPYYTNRRDLYKEISSYAVTLINLFAVVFLIAALIAFFLARRISGPLNLIKEQMGLVKLGVPNAPIQWEHKDELGLLIDEYNKMIYQLEINSNKLAESEREGAWREMAKQVAHEIKNPLTPMKLSLQHLQFAIQRKDENLEEKLKKTSELLIHQIDSLAKMAEEFSAFAKMPAPVPEEVVLSELLKKTIALFEKEENFTLNLHSWYDAIIVKVDAMQLSRVFTNIIKNATQAIAENQVGFLEVWMQQKDNFIEVLFKDNGKGIPFSLQDKIFSPNFSTKNSGMGLGLAMSKKIVEGFGGTITFTSKENVGTTFVVRIPIYGRTTS